MTTASNFAWKPRIPDNQWLQLDVYQVKRVTAVVTQGLLRNSASSYCQTYTLYHSKSGAMWQAYEENNVEKVRKVDLQFVFAKRYHMSKVLC